MAPPRRSKGPVALGEILAWLLFTALLVPAGFVGWVIGHYSGGHAGTRTVTITAAAPAKTTTAAATTTAATTTAAAPKTTTAAASTGSNAAAGKTVFLSNGCGSCHTFTQAGTKGKVGPELNTAPAADAKKDGNMALSAFVKESIVDPNAYISPGFPKSVMPQTFGKSLSATQLADLVAFIVAGKQ